MMNTAEQIKQKAIELGFDLVGITDTSAIGAWEVARFEKWLAEGKAGEMGYLSRNFEKRMEPARLLGNAKSVICVGLNYTPPKEPRREMKTAAGRVANYARYEDYHGFIKGRLFRLAEFIDSIAGDDVRFKICVDSAPVAERALGQRAGLGFIGKNHMLINPDVGSQIFLGEIISDLELETDSAVEQNCGGCDKCITACPTGALSSDGGFDANKCISYLTIEHKGVIGEILQKKIGAAIFGCDACVLACPYNQDACKCKNKDFEYHSERAYLDLEQILEMDADEFDSIYANSALSRSGVAKMKETAGFILENLSEMNQGL